MVKTKAPAVILAFREIKVSIPSKKLRKLHYSYGFLEEKEVSFLRAILTRLDHAQNKIAHARSIVEKIALRTQGNTEVTCYKTEN